MAETDRIKKLHSYVDKLDSLMRKLDDESDITDAEDELSDIYAKFEILKRRETHYKVVVNIIKNITPEISADLSLLVKEYEKSRIKIVSKMKKDLDNVLQKIHGIPTDRAEKLNDEIRKIFEIDTSLKNIIAVVHDSITGLLDFVENKK